MSDKDEILVNFQAFTGIDDVATCFDILEQKGWDLSAAVNSVLPQEFSAAQSSSDGVTHSGSGRVVDMTAATPPPPYMDLTREAFGEASYVESCSIGVYHHSKLIPLQLPPDTSIAQVKEGLERETGIPPPEQVISGWPGNVTDEMTLHQAGLCAGAYHLRLEHHPAAERPSSLGVGVARERPVVEGQETKTQDGVIMVSDGDDDTVSSSSHYSDAQESLNDGVLGTPDALDDDALFSPDAPEDLAAKAMKEPLVPRTCTEPSDALQCLTHQFEQRYGAMHPLFFIGSLQDAVKEATGGMAISESRRPLFIYLHHDASVLSNIFCSQLLCSESVVNYLTTNFITWAWDLTFQEHRIKLLEMVHDCFGKIAKASVDEVTPEQLPAILLVYKMKGSLDIRNIIQGETNLDALMSTLIATVEEHQIHVDWESREERERIARERMIEEQNLAYQESLFADRKKDKQRLLEEQQKLEQEEVEEIEKQQKKETRQQMNDSVPAEPSPGSREKVATIRLRLPDGTTEQRRFLASHTLQDLLNFLGSKDYMTSDYKMITRVPRRDLSELSVNQTLEEAGLCPQEMIFIEER